MYVDDLTKPIGISWKGSNVSTCQLSGLSDISFSTVHPNTGSVTAHLTSPITSDDTTQGVFIQCVKNDNGTPVQVRDRVTVIQRTVSGDPGFSVTPSRGNAPLTVKFQYLMNREQSCDSSIAYRLNFGDGTSIPLNKPAGTCQSYVQYTEHTYPEAGAYKATLFKLVPSCETCMGVAREDVLGTATISVGIVPSCKLTSDKNSYNFGDTITFRWDSEKASYAVWVPDTSGKDYLVLSNPTAISQWLGRRPLRQVS